MNAAFRIALFILGMSAICLIYWPLFKQDTKTCEVTWYRAKDHTVAVNPRHSVPDGAYIKFTNKATAPERIVIVRKRGHMKPGAKADFDLCPEAFEQLAPLSDGRLKQVEWQIVFP